ncbi:uncharacterized protein LOC135206352 [Macrobrachium nipponense]|uniref:uncharacterized protein LOC135206352 n=1 Tax=Macrobrachium nipponense TaxID=159736 RepID=UPI0030C80442
MKGFKSSGGLTHGRGITESTLAQWIKAMPASTQVCDAVEKFTGVSSATTEQHVELRESRQFNDGKHLQILQNWLRSHSPFQETFSGLVSLGTGIIADDLVNCDTAKSIGLKVMHDMDGKKFSTIHLKRKNAVRSISVMRNGLKVREDVVAVNSQQLFSRIICVLKNDDQLANYMTYELAPKPPSLFDDISVRKGLKAALVTKLESYGPWEGLVSDEYQYVVDGGHLLHKVVWPRPAMYRDIFQA